MLEIFLVVLSDCVVVVAQENIKVFRACRGSRLLAVSFGSSAF